MNFLLQEDSHMLLRPKMQRINHNSVKMTKKGKLYSTLRYQTFQHFQWETSSLSRPPFPHPLSLLNSFEKD